MVEEKDNREKVVKEERAERELCWPLCMHAEPCFWANSICENYSLCIQYRQLFMSCFFPDLPRYSEGRLSPTGVRIVLGPKCLSVNALRKLLPLMKSFGAASQVSSANKLLSTKLQISSVPVPDSHSTT